ncbi:hypothetical protein [Nostoc sp.]|uniref:hypothetical protein n=1 Tax=Nostoc sp. TaxID=1180 RepID=UPI002FF880E6
MVFVSADDLAITQPSHSLINQMVDIGRRCFRYCHALYLTTDSEDGIEWEAYGEIAKRVMIVSVVSKQ